MAKLFLAAGSLLAGFSVVTGAFGAHVMRGKFSDYAMEVFEKAVRYEMYHALSLIFIGILFLLRDHAVIDGNPVFLKAAGFLMLAGILFFSGSLYILGFSGIRILGAVTPVGGTAFIAGWVFLFLFVLSIKSA
jgi:uncharacterized membrane protein YgdD (TMEM256/DUF423 family)